MSDIKKKDDNLKEILAMRTHDLIPNKRQVTKNDVKKYVKDFKLKKQMEKDLNEKTK
jgi:hypothetical protein